MKLLSSALVLFAGVLLVIASLFASLVSGSETAGTMALGVFIAAAGLLGWIVSMKPQAVGRQGTDEADE